MAVLLALTAVDLGVDRAVGCASAGLGKQRLATALPYLQPLALLGGPGRHAVAEHDRAAAHAARQASQHRMMLRPGGGPSILHDLIAAVHEACGVEVPKKARLARLTWKKAAALAGAFLVLHLILPQLANAGGAWAALKQANWWWLLLALPAALSSQVCSALLQEGTIPERLPFRPNVLAVRGLVPVGGMALNLRFLQKAGVDTGAATASVGLQSLAGAASSVVAAAAFFAWTSQRHSGVRLGAPTGLWLLPVLVAVTVAGCLLEKVWHFLKAAGDSVATVTTRPSKIAEGVLGALGLPLVQIISLVACLHALGVPPPIGQVGAVYITA